MVDNELRDLIINDHSSYNLNLIWIEDLVFESIKVGKKSYGDIFAYYVECEKVHGINSLYIFFMKNLDILNFDVVVLLRSVFENDGIYYP